MWTPQTLLHPFSSSSSSSETPHCLSLVLTYVFTLSSCFSLYLLSPLYSSSLLLLLSSPYVLPLSLLLPYLLASSPHFLSFCPLSMIITSPHLLSFLLPSCLLQTFGSFFFLPSILSPHFYSSFHLSSLLVCLLLIAWMSGFPPTLVPPPICLFSFSAIFFSLLLSAVFIILSTSYPPPHSM